MADEPAYNYISAHLALKDITDKNITIQTSDCFTLQDLHYRCSRRRDETGVPYGPTEPSFLTFTILAEADTTGKEIFQRMKTFSPLPFSIIFSAVFTDGSLTSHADAMVGYGYVVDVEESFRSEPLQPGKADQMLISAKVLLTKLVFEGSSDDPLPIPISND